MKDEFQKGRDWVAENLNVDQNVMASFFETIIRVTGGLLSAYDLSGDKIFLDKAVELADRMAPAFDTPNGLPMTQINFHTYVYTFKTSFCAYTYALAL